MEHLTSYERELLERASGTYGWLPVNPATVVKLLEEIKRLRAVVEKLPKTADGVPITPGMKLYRVFDYGNGNVSEPHETKPITGFNTDESGRLNSIHFENGWTMVAEHSETYSTFEAAEAAKGQVTP